MESLLCSLHCHTSQGEKKVTIVFSNSNFTLQYIGICILTMLLIPLTPKAKSSLFYLPYRRRFNTAGHFLLEALFPILSHFFFFSPLTFRKEDVRGSRKQRFQNCLYWKPEAGFCLYVRSGLKPQTQRLQNRSRKEKQVWSSEKRVAGEIQ